jgi:hypothetical protein
MTRYFAVTVRDFDSAPIVGAAVFINDRYAITGANGRARVEDISTDWHQVQLTIVADQFITYSESVNLDEGAIPPFGDVDWPDIYLEDALPPRLHASGDRFMVGPYNWTWKGSTDFRLAELVSRGVDIRPLLRDRRDTGANLVRVLSMKANNTGWEFNPRGANHAVATRKLFEAVGEMGMYCEWVIFADTKRMMSNPAEQQDYYGYQSEIVRDYPHVLLELVNEDKHPTQAINAQLFRRPEGIVSSHGSGLSDVQPVKPLWDYATYHSRRTGGLAKIISNYSPYVFQDTFPTPCPYIPEETLKPEQYSFDTLVATRLGQHAACGAGGTFHHSAWNDPRFFNDEERSCAEAFFTALEY